MHLLSILSMEKRNGFSSLQDTLQLIKEGNKWLIRKDIPQQNGKQSHD